MSSIALLAVVVLGASVLERLLPNASTRPAPRGRLAGNLAVMAAFVTSIQALAPLVALFVVWSGLGSQTGALRALALPAPLALVFGMLAYDLGYYVVHRLLHWGPFWRLHALHHSDVAIDWTTTYRHHPLEALASALFFAGWTALLGLSEMAIIAGWTLHLAWDAVGHLDVRLPARLDRLLRLVVVTPLAHAMHHSARREEADSNFGAVLLVWDRLFGTYRASDSAPRRFGLDRDIPGADTRLLPMLLLPFSRDLAGAGTNATSTPGPRDHPPASGQVRPTDLR